LPNMKKNKSIWAVKIRKCIDYNAIKKQLCF